MNGITLEHTQNNNEHFTASANFIGRSFRHVAQWPTCPTMFISPDDTAKWRKLFNSQSLKNEKFDFQYAT